MFTFFIPIFFWPKRKKDWGKIQTGVLFAMDMEKIYAQICHRCEHLFEVYYVFLVEKSNWSV